VESTKSCKGDVIVATNPDVTFGPGAIQLLADALDDRTAIAGPALFWDDAHAWRLPPADLTTGTQKLDEVLASRSRAWFAQRDRRRFAKRVAFWELTQTTRVDALSGAVMAIRAKDFDEVGGFDERFRLYFEEIDFQRRLTARRKRLAYVPAARVRHIFNQSAGQQSDEAAALYARSELQYLEKWNGPFAGRLLKKLERPMSGFDAQPLDGPFAIHGDVVVEASPLSSFATAAGHFPRGDRVDLPPEVWKAFRGGALYLRIVDRNSRRVVATYGRYRT
jgi:GT2 family glycosyltransferase